MLRSQRARFKQRQEGTSRSVLFGSARFSASDPDMEFDGSLLIPVNVTDDVKSEEAHRRRMTLHCLQCSTVLGDSLGVCGEIQCMDSIMCLKVTNDVVVSDATETGHKGKLANCIYSSLKCRCCRSNVGRVIHSAPSRLASVRSIFLLYKANISCYVLNSSSMVKASTLSFDLQAFRESMSEVKQAFEAQLDRMTCTKNRVFNLSGSSGLEKCV